MDIQKIHEEDAEALCRLYYSFFESQGHDFTHLDQFLEKNIESVRKLIKQTSSQDIKPSNVENTITIKDFLKTQQKHLTELQKKDPSPEVNELIDIKFKLVA